MITLLAPENPAIVQLQANEKASNAALLTLKAVTVSSFKSFWYGDVSPESLLVVLGTNATAAFLAHQKTVLFLISMGVPMDPVDYVPPRAYTLQPSGAITLDAPADP